MKATPPVQCSTVASFLTKGYSLNQIEAKTGLEKPTIGRIDKELEVDKKTILEAILLSLLNMINRLLFNKFQLADLDHIYIHSIHYLYYHWSDHGLHTNLFVSVDNK